MDNVDVTVFSLIGRTFGCDPNRVTRSTQAEDIDGWDSLSHTVLLVGIERQLGIHLNHDEVLDVEDVGGLIDIVARTVAAKSVTGA